MPEQSGPLGAHDADSPHDLDVTLGQAWTISGSTSAADQHIYPALWRLRDGTLLLDYHLDADIDFARRACLRSVDDGRTWTRDPHRIDREESVIELADGTILGYGYHALPAAPGSKQHLGVMCLSRDGAQSFEGPLEVTVNMPRASRMPIPDPDPKYGIVPAMRFWRSVLELPDGSLLASLYGFWEGDTKNRSVVALSQDRGLTFDYLATVGYDPDPGLGRYFEGYNESVLSWTSTGDILCLMRVGSFHSLRQAHSSDHGRTWSEPDILDASLDPEAVGQLTEPDNVGAASVDPDLVLMSNGVIACSFGRPGNSIMFDPTGTGHHWQKPIMVYWGGLTGYTGIREIAPGKLLYVYDKSFNDGSGMGLAHIMNAVEITVQRQ